MKRNLTIFLICSLTLIGGFLRFFNNTQNPVSLNSDEVAYGYSAYSILKTGRDENGLFLPIFFQSIGDYKNPLLIYSLVPSIAVFGLNEFSVRFTTALAGTLTIPAFFLLLRSLQKNLRIAIIGALFMAISPMSIYYSRFASDHLVGLFILILGIWFLIKMLSGSRIWAPFASITLSLSMYTYHSQRLFVPLFLLIYLGLNIKKIGKNIIFFFVPFFILLIPMLLLTFFGEANTRAGMVFLSQDIDYTRYVILDHLQKQPLSVFSNENFLLLFFWIKRYLNYFQPDFLFFNGLNMTSTGTLGQGVLYLFEAPLLILGIISLIKEKRPIKNILIAWILVGLIPASLTNNEQSSGRSLIILPAIITITAFGVIRFFYLISKITDQFLKFGAISIYFLLVLVTLIQTFLIFSIHFPTQRGEAFMEGTKEAVLYALKNKEKYREIVFDPYRGIEAPYIVNIPHMYILFYSQYDPKTFQKEVIDFPKFGAHFDKFTIRQINWREDYAKSGVLFIGSPWSLPHNNIREENILKKIYLSDGNLALLIVSP